MIAYSHQYNTTTGQHKTISADKFIERLTNGEPTYEQTGGANNITNIYLDYDRTVDEPMTAEEIQDNEDTVLMIVKKVFEKRFIMFEPEFTLATCHRMTKKGFKFSMRLFNSSVRDRKDKLKIFAEMLNKELEPHGLAYFDTGVYQNNRYMRCINTSKPDENAPLKLVFGNIEDTIITLAHPNAHIPQWQEEPAKKAQTVNATLQTIDEQNKTANAIQYWIEKKQFTTEFADGYHTWMNMGFAIHSVLGECGRTLWHKFSALSPKYDFDFCNDKWDKEIVNAHKKYTIGSIIKWAQTQGDKSTFMKGMEILKPKPEYAKKIQQKYQNINDLVFDSVNEREFRDMVYDINKDYLLHINGMLYLYFEQEWIRFEIGKPYQLRHLIIEIFYEYIRHAYFIVSRLEGEAAIEGDKDKKKELRDKLDKLERIKTATYVKNITSLVIDKLMMVKTKNINFDVGKEQAFNIHFRNGVYELDTQKFRMRTEQDYITKWLDYDYVDETEIPKDILDYPEDFFRKLHRDNTHREFCIAYNAYCITGDTTKQIFKWNQGKASNGKSTEFAVMNKCFPIYVQKMNNRVLEIEYDKRHKYLHELTVEPIRMIYMEELPSKHLDVEFIKDFVDGRELDVEVMHGTKAKIICNAKLAIASQHDPQMNVDAGIIRRGIIQRYTSTFMDDVEDDWQKYIFAKSEGLESIFNDDMYKLAMFHMLRKRIGKMAIPTELKKEFETTIEDTDEVRKMLKEQFEFTNDEKDAISRAQVMEILGNPNKQLEAMYMQKLKLLCTYKSQSETRYNTKKVKGRFFGIKIKEQEQVIIEETEEMEGAP